MKQPSLAGGDFFAHFYGMLVNISEHNTAFLEGVVAFFLKEDFSALCHFSKNIAQQPSTLCKLEQSRKDFAIQQRKSMIGFSS